MSKKHFESLAKMVRNLREETPNTGITSGLVHVNKVAGELAKLCCEHNTRFDAYRFLRACGVEMPKV